MSSARNDSVPADGARPGQTEARVPESITRGEKHSATDCRTGIGYTVIDGPGNNRLIGGFDHSHQP